MTDVSSEEKEVEAIKNPEAKASSVQEETVVVEEVILPPKRRKKLFSFKKLLVTLFILLVLGFIAWITAFLYFGYTNKFPIENVKVIGKYQYVKESDIESTLSPFIAGKGLFAFSEWKAEKALEQLPGVESASIWRVPPSQIKVIIRERSALARFTNGDLLSNDGVIFQTTNPAGAQNLPLLNGDPHYAKDMLKMLESLEPIFSIINAQVTGLGIASNGDWSVQINNQTWIMLGKNDLQNRVTNFITAYPVLMQSQNATSGGTLTYVDLRYSHGFSTIWIGVAAPTTTSSSSNSSGSKATTTTSSS